MALLSLRWLSSRKLVRVFGGRGAGCNFISEHLGLIIERTAAAVIPAPRILASHALEDRARGVRISKQLLALFQDGSWTDDGVTQQNLRALGARLQRVGAVVGRRLLRGRALRCAVAMRTDPIELRRLWGRCHVRALRRLLCQRQRIAH